MTQMVTRCPKCAAAFRITSAQLESAKGSVRCGSCLHIFKAQDHIVTQPAVPTAKTDTKTADAKPAAKVEAPKASNSTQAAPKTTRPTVRETAIEKAKSNDKPKEQTKRVEPEKAKVVDDEDDDFLISDDMDKPTEKESTYEFDGFIDMNLQPKQTVSLFEREIRYEEEKDEPKDLDESWAEQLLEEEEATPQLRVAKPTPLSTPAFTGETKAAPEKTHGTNSILAPEPSSSAPARNAPLFNLIAEPERTEEDEFSEAFLNATKGAATSTDTSGDEVDKFSNSIFSDEEDEVAEELAKSGSGKRQGKGAGKLRAFDNSRAALLMNIMPAPVEFTARRVRRWYQKKLWSTLAIIAGILLFAQVAYFKFDYFSRVEPYRTFYVLLCPTFKCKVPSLVDTRQISAYQLVVRGHPTVANALKVDAMILNKAPFEQPFPDIILAFSTLDDVPVALRRFTPKEYLGGELAGMDHIVPKQPVHITLELVDPGPEAVNYHVSIP